MGGYRYAFLAYVHIMPHECVYIYIYVYLVIYIHTHQRYPILRHRNQSVSPRLQSKIPTGCPLGIKRGNGKSHEMEVSTWENHRTKWWTYHTYPFTGDLPMKTLHFSWDLSIATFDDLFGRTSTRHRAQGGSGHRWRQGLGRKFHHLKQGVRVSNIVGW